MSNSIEAIKGLTPIKPLENIQAKSRNEGEDFSSFLRDSLNKLDQSQTAAEQATIAMVKGETEDFHTPVIAMEKASLTLGLAVTVRNKVLDAYHEVMRMQI